MSWSARWPFVYVFVVWSEAREADQRVLDDLHQRFTVLDVVEVTWTQASFARSLTRMYGEALPTGSAKEQHCGTAPFLLAVVRDERPQFRPRRTSGGLRLVNARVAAGRARYREWTGAGYRVHASDSVVETERNLVLLLGRGRRSFDRRWNPGDGVRPHRADPLGTDGWQSLDQLRQVLAPYGARRVVQAGRDVVDVSTADTWWAEQLTGGVMTGPHERTVQIGGRPMRVSFGESGSRRRRLGVELRRRLPGRL